VEPETRFARLGESRIAYQVVGEGPPDLVLTAGTFGNIDLDWEDPMVARFYRRLATFCRLIRFDRRGSGSSDPLPLDALPPWEAYMEEVAAVMDAVGSRRATIMGVFDAGPMAALFAATKPDRTVALILANTAARLLASEDYSIGAPPDAVKAVIDRVEESWGTDAQAWMQAPSRADDEHFRRWFAKYTRGIASPTAVKAYLYAMVEADARPILASVHVPVLVVHRTNYPLFRIEHGRYLAEQIEGARFVELPGADGALAWENTDLLLDEIEEFLTGIRRGADPDRALATVLFTDIVGSTERVEELRDERWIRLLDRHDETARRVIGGFGGRLIKTTGDGILATFDGPGRGIRAAGLLREEFQRAGLDIRAGVHTGEVELRDGDVGGIAVHIGARVMAAAAPGEILVSRTVRDLIAGSEIRLEDRGLHQLKGIEGHWQLFTVAGI
jgi:class 3 adenylate cyclase